MSYKVTYMTGQDIHNANIKGKIFEESEQPQAINFFRELIAEGCYYHITLSRVDELF